jgi:hypothetical protein
VATPAQAAILTKTLEQRLADILPGDAHGLGPDVEADPMHGLQHLLGPVVMQHRADIDAEADRLAVEEFLPGLVFQRIEEEMVDALDMARVPARAVEGGAPAQPVHQHLDALVAQLVDLIRMREDILHLVQGVARHLLVIGPFRLAFAHHGGVAPIEHAGVEAEDVADAGVVELGRGGADDVIVDIDGLGHGPADIAHHPVDAHARALAPGGVHAERGLDLE